VRLEQRGRSIYCRRWIEFRKYDNSAVTDEVRIRLVLVRIERIIL
jgi:hypothetical protein